ncbi:MAG: GNAT family N-acetyltransferase [Pseudodonghicola sp.]|uniref:GNAT family N-acetyltransferase n=1 Tax=Pseudodonghicola sp. TaxID=1969463 RepID=UPI003A9875B7
MRIIEARTAAERQACYDLRFEVFVDEQGVTPESEIDAADDQATHLLMLEAEAPIGTLRILYEAADARIGRVCLRQSARGKGLGAALMRAALAAIAAGPKVDKIRLSAQVSVLGFYEGLGFLAYGPVYDDEGIPHQSMERAAG